ncbi:MAG: DUF262 domain-containing HNH endonuclease family protein [Solirubrobacterales bacterium]
MPARGRIDYEMAGITSVVKKGEYRVPIYQRSYAWETSEVDEFWEDIKGALDADEPDYFLGTLVLTPHGDEKRITIIDGQQRLATTTLFIAALRDAWKERGDEPQANDIQDKYISTFDRRAREHVPRLVLNEEDDPYFRALVVDSTGPTAKRESHERLENAFENLKGKIDLDLSEHGKQADERLLRWLDFLDDQALVITVTVPTEADAFVIFETLNDRGADLTIGDLLKNYLFMRSGSRLDTVQTSWVSALSALYVSAENELFVSFLRHHWSSKHGAVRERDLYSSIKQHITNPAQAVEYADELVDAARDYAALLSASHDYWSQKNGFSATAKANVETLLTLELEQNRPLLLAVMRHFERREIQTTMHALVNWSVRGIIVGGIGGGRTERAFCEAAVAVRAGKIKKTSQLLEQLSYIVPDDDTFRASFATARQTKASVSRYLLLVLERAKDGDSEPELVPNSNQDEVNLEHVLPRNAKESDWPSFKSEEISAWANRIGNHCLLRKTENAQIGNKPWSDKKPILMASSLKLTRMAGKKKNWTRKEIGARQNELAALAVKAWPREVPK